MTGLITCRCGCGLTPKLGNLVLSGSHLRGRFSDEERFWLFVSQRPQDGCWLWEGATTGSAEYGSFMAQGQKERAHRYAWGMAAHSPAPDDASVCHTCDTPRCVRNDEPGIHVVNGIARPRFGHLFLAPHAANMTDKVEKGRQRHDACPPDRQVRGEAIWSAKLTPTTVREVRKLGALGISTRAIGRQMGVTHTTVRGILAGRLWSHVCN